MSTRRQREENLRILRLAQKGQLTPELLGVEDKWTVTMDLSGDGLTIPPTREEVVQIRAGKLLRVTLNIG